MRDAGTGCPQPRRLHVSLSDSDPDHAFVYCPRPFPSCPFPHLGWLRPRRASKERGGAAAFTRLGLIPPMRRIAIGEPAAGKWATHTEVRRRARRSGSSWWLRLLPFPLADTLGRIACAVTVNKHSVGASVPVQCLHNSGVDWKPD